MKLLLLHKPPRKQFDPTQPITVNLSQVLWIEVLQPQGAGANGAHARLCFESKMLDVVETPEMIQDMCDPHGAPLTTT